MIGWIFPGQGAQRVGMGRDFAENFSEARELFEEADEILGCNLSRVIFEGPEEELTRTETAQLAIFVTSMAILRVLDGAPPAMCAGLSLGEYTALCASGRIAFADALRLVQARGQFMSEACDAQPGAMAAVLGVDEVETPEGVWVANLNCPGQVVVSGTPEGVAQVVAGAKRAVPLQVHGAFHSGLMQEAQDRLEPLVRAAPLQGSAVKLAMNAVGGFVEDLNEVREQLIRQVTGTVRWESCIRAMGMTQAIEIGPGRVLAGFNKRIGVPTVSIGTVEDLAKC